MFDIFAQIGLWPMIAALALGFLAGFVKGSVGFGAPLVIVASLTLFMDPKLVVAGLILPILVSNAQQMLRQGPSVALQAMKDYRVYLIVLAIFIFLSAQWMSKVPARQAYLLLGVPVFALSLIQLSGWKPVIPHAWRPAATVIAAALSGILGGVAGTWGPTTVMYLVALETPKVTQVVVQGVIFGLGGVILLLGHLQSGILNWATLPFSAAMILPIFLGMNAGFAVNDRIDQETFRKATLFVLVLAGLNLIRRGLLG